MKANIINYLADRYDIKADAIRYLDDPDYREGAIECYGPMQNTTQEGWFFAGFEDEIESQIKREAAL